MKILFVVIFACLSWNAQAALKIQAWSLDNGARVLFVESRALPILDISVEFDAGSRRDPQSKAGTAWLANSMLARGLRAVTGTSPEPAMSEAQVSDALADIAAQLNDGTGKDRAGASLRTLSSRAEREQATLLLSRILAHPDFPQAVLEREKSRLISAIKEELTQPESLATRAFWPLLYASHPYGNIPSVVSVEAINREDLLAFHRSHYVANRAVISMIGDISREEANAIATQVTARLPQGAPLPELPAVPQAMSKEQRIAHPALQSHILVGAPALVRGDPDFFALNVGNYILGGGGFVSRLMHEVREKRGLAYGIESSFSPMAQHGPFEIGVQTQKEQTGQALKVVHATLRDFLRKGPTPRELKAAKDNLIGGFVLRIDNNRDILAHIAMIGFYNMPLDYLDTWTSNIARVTAADVRVALNRKLSPDKLATVVVGTE